MIVYAEKENVQAVMFEPDEPGELELYARASVLCLEGKTDKDMDPELRHKILDRAAQMGPAAWERSYRNKKLRHFSLLMVDEEGEAHTVIGEACLQIKKDETGQEIAFFKNGYVHKDYRGQGYCALLHEARRQYLEEETQVKVIETTIKADNFASLRAASKQGFEQYKVDEEERRIYLRRPVHGIPLAPQSSMAVQQDAYHMDAA